MARAALIATLAIVRQGEVFRMAFGKARLHIKICQSVATRQVSAFQFQAAPLQAHIFLHGQILVVPAWFLAVNPGPPVDVTHHKVRALLYLHMGQAPVFQARHYGTKFSGEIESKPGETLQKLIYAKKRALFAVTGPLRLISSGYDNYAGLA